VRGSRRNFSQYACPAPCQDLGFCRRSHPVPGNCRIFRFPDAKVFRRSRPGAVPREGFFPQSLSFSGRCRAFRFSPPASPGIGIPSSSTVRTSAAGLTTFRDVGDLSVDLPSTSPDIGARSPHETNPSVDGLTPSRDAVSPSASLRRVLLTSPLGLRTLRQFLPMSRQNFFIGLHRKEPLPF